IGGGGDAGHAVVPVELHNRHFQLSPFFDLARRKIETTGVTIERQRTGWYRMSCQLQSVAMDQAPQEEPKHRDQRENQEGGHSIPDLEPVRRVRPGKLEDRVTEVINYEPQACAHEIEQASPGGGREQDVADSHPAGSAAESDDRRPGTVRSHLKPRSGLVQTPRLPRCRKTAWGRPTTAVKACIIQNASGNHTIQKITRQSPRSKRESMATLTTAWST